MATIKLTPSTIYNAAGTNYLTITSASNAYTDTDSNTCTTVTNTSASTSNRYIYIRGFDFSSVPSNATVSSFTVKLRAYESGLNTGTSYAPRLCNGSSALANTTASESLGTTSKVITIPTSTIQWSTITNYGSNFGILIYVRRANSNTTGYAYIQGAEIEVTYTVPNYYNITATSQTTDGTISPSSQSIKEGTDATVTIDIENMTGYLVTDNNVDVTNSCIRHQKEGSTNNATFIPSSFDSVNSVYNKNVGDEGVYSTNYIDNGLTNHSSSTRCALYAVTGSGQTSSMYYNFDCSSIPQNVVINSVSCQFKGGSQGSSYYSSYTAQLTTGTTLKGSSTSVTGSNSSPSTVTIDGGTSWTRAELDNIKIKFSVTRGSNNTTTDSTWSFFGATLTVNYTVLSDEHYYTYTITNVTGAHTVIFKKADSLFIKYEGSWVRILKLYVKQNGSWVEQPPSYIEDNNITNIRRPG